MHANPVACADYFQAGKLARSIWAETCATDEKDAILGVQQARNAISASVLLATISLALASAGIPIMFDQAKMQQIEKLAVSLCSRVPGVVQGHDRNCNHTSKLRSTKLTTS